jgi:hypothetical protein
MMKQHPNMLDMVNISMQEMKNIETKRIPKVHANRPVYDKLSSNLEQKVNDIQLS